MYEEMRPYLVKAKELLPLNVAPFLCRGDLQRIYTGLGKLRYERGKEKVANSSEQYVEMMQSYEHYTKAIAINPHDILAVQGIAETVAELEFLYPVLFPKKKNPYDALHLYKRMVELEPNGFDSNYSYSNYLHRKGLQKELFQQLRNFARIFPSYSYFTRASFYSSNTEEAIVDGLHDAVTAGTMTSSACFSLSIFYEREKDYHSAIDYYQKGMEVQKKRNTDKNHLQLGSLFLQTDDNESAYRKFEASLRMM